MKMSMETVSDKSVAIKVINKLHEIHLDLLEKYYGEDFAFSVGSNSDFVSASFHCNGECEIFNFFPHFTMEDSEELIAKIKKFVYEAMEQFEEGAVSSKYIEYVSKLDIV